MGGMVLGHFSRTGRTGPARRSIEARFQGRLCQSLLTQDRRTKGQNVPMPQNYLTILLDPFMFFVFFDMCAPNGSVVSKSAQDQDGSSAFVLSLSFSRGLQSFQRVSVCLISVRRVCVTLPTSFFSRSSC